MNCTTKLEGLSFPFTFLLYTVLNVLHHCIFVAEVITQYLLNNTIINLVYYQLKIVTRKTSHLRGFVFSNYRNLNNGNLLLELGEILKQKWYKTTKNGNVKTYIYIKAL